MIIGRIGCLVIRALRVPTESSKILLPIYSRGRLNLQDAVPVYWHTPAMALYIAVVFRRSARQKESPALILKKKPRGLIKSFAFLLRQNVRRFGKPKCDCYWPTSQGF